MQQKAHLQSYTLQYFLTIVIFMYNNDDDDDDDNNDNYIWKQFLFQKLTNSLYV